MEPSGDVRDAMLRFYERLSSSDVASFDRLVSGDPTTLVIGTSPGEWVTERDRLRYGFESEGMGVVPGPDPPVSSEATSAGSWTSRPTSSPAGPAG